MTAWSELRADEAMSKGFVLIEEGASLAEALEVFEEEEVSGAPVADPEGRVVGVLSVFDILGHMAGIDPARNPGSFYFRGTIDWDAHSEAWARQAAKDPRIAGRTVGEIMDREVVLLRRDATLGEVVDELRRSHLHRVLIVDGNQLLGTITVHDVLRGIAEAD